jgi:hypothetical protein
MITLKSHRAEFIGHGYCTFSDNSSNESKRGTAQIQGMPYMRLTSGQGGLAEWQYLNPSVDLFPYESRTRWFRTFNDDYMIIMSTGLLAKPPSSGRRANAEGLKP